MKDSKVVIVQKILNANDEIALANRTLLDEYGVFTINIMASPGSGKTSLILKTIESLSPEYQIAVIEGDTAPVTIDADKVHQKGIPVTQINTGGECHLDALMVKKGLARLDLANLDLVIIENVGNLICPAAFQLGAHASVVVASTPEGDDKPYKYPGIYRGIDCLVLNKIDLLPYLDFDYKYFVQGLRILNKDIQIFSLSCKTGVGLEKWVNWIQSKISK